MSPSQSSITPCLQAANSEAAAIESLLAGFASELKAVCSSNGQLDVGHLDAHQQKAYDLALCQAELAAIKANLEFALRDDATILQEQLALVFVADALQKLLQRLTASDDAWRQAALYFFQRTAISEILTMGLSPDFQEAVGEQLSQEAISDPGNMLDQEKAMMRASFARFARDIVEPLAEAIHREDLDIPETLLQQAAELGCFGSSIPERFGGLQPDNGADSLGMIVVTEELSRASLGAAGSLITRPEIAARALLAGGTDAQQQHWLPALASGQTLCAIAITEPDTGSDVAAVSLRATPVEGGWRLNGSKTWSTFAGRSELLVVLARSEPGESGYKGLSLFLVEKPAFPGHEFNVQQEQGGSLSGKAIATLGYRGMHSFELFFNDFFVPTEALLGGDNGRGKGFYFTMAGFAGGRIQTAARANGVMQAAYDRALSYTAERKAFTKPLADFQLTRIKLARMFATLTASRLLSYQVARNLDEGAGQMQASLVKLFACRAAEWVTREAMQLHGGMGYAEESPVSRYFVDARVLSIFEGAEEVLAIKVIARELIESAD